ncbi:MAG: GNAT family N-acetyltransferase [Anaerolineae bacterium]|nr:GNAT family N-acetyltransferase [Anaerolineae bacterium]
MSTSDHPITLRTLTHADVPQISAIHMRAFPRRAMTALGSEAVARYYAWLLTDAHPHAYRMGAFDGERLIGFNFAGRYNGALSGFLQRNRSFLIARVAARPWLLLTNELFRSRIALALNLLRRRPAKPDAQRTVSPPREFSILAIAVDPAVQGSGVGRLLMQDAEAEALRRGARVMNLSVDQDNAQAIRFYEHGGWRKLTDASGSWDGNMVKTIPPTSDPPPG